MGIVSITNKALMCYLSLKSAWSYNLWDKWHLGVNKRETGKILQVYFKGACLYELNVTWLISSHCHKVQDTNILQLFLKNSKWTLFVTVNKFNHCGIIFFYVKFWHQLFFCFSLNVQIKSAKLSVTVWMRIFWSKRGAQYFRAGW